MLEHEKVVFSFLEMRKSYDEVVWAVLCGSFVTWSPSAHSDIDLHILLEDTATRRERWNVSMGGFLIEYFINPVRLHYEYAEEDYQQRRIVNAHMFVTWKLLFDTTWAVTKLIDDMKQHIDKTYKPMDHSRLELVKYGIRDMCDNLQEIYDAQWSEFPFVYYASLYALFDLYAEYLQYRHIEKHKVARFLKQKSQRNKYLIDDFPDALFSQKFLEAITVDDNDTHTMMKMYEQLTEHVLQQMWWFSIDWWKLRTDC